jgi:hypothetical protein
MEGTQNDALNLPNGGGIEGPYKSLSAANGIASNRPENANAPTGIPGLSINPGGGVTVNNPLTSLEQFLSELSNPHLWMRVGEVVLGLLLIAVGIAELTDAVPVATKIATMVK